MVPHLGTMAGLTKNKKTIINAQKGSGFIFSGIHMTKNDEKHMPEAMEGVPGSKNDFKNIIF